MSVYWRVGKAKEVDEALELFHQLRSGANSMRPDVVSCNSIISACERQSRWRDAIQLLQVGGAEIQVNLLGVNSCISACGKAAQWRHALSQLATEASVDLISFNGTLSALGPRRQEELLPFVEGSWKVNWMLALELMMMIAQMTLEANRISCPGGNQGKQLFHG
eukprot:symbB.v1.2.033340.t1/scaffold4129.1/size44250/2